MEHVVGHDGTAGRAKRGSERRFPRSVRADERDRATADTYGTRVQRERTAQAQQQTQDRTAQIRAGVIERRGRWPRAPDVDRTRIDPEARAVGVIEVDAPGRAEDLRRSSPKTAA